jgi:hypothetical protein
MPPALMVARGLMMFMPVYFGALPPMGSNMDTPSGLMLPPAAKRTRGPRWARQKTTSSPHAITKVDDGAAEALDGIASRPFGRKLHLCAKPRGAGLDRDQIAAVGIPDRRGTVEKTTLRDCPFD